MLKLDVSVNNLVFEMYRKYCTVMKKEKSIVNFEELSVVEKEAWMSLGELAEETYNYALNH
jgi:hypothetical protein